MTLPLPDPRHQRFETLAYGMFVHWGLYSQLGQGEWIQHIRKIPMQEYAALKDTFTAKAFDGRALAALAREAGMRYITLTTRHHDGFSLYDTRGLSDHDAPHSAAARDLVREFVEGCRAEGIVPFFYHTTLDWYQESFEKDFNAYLDYLRQSVEILCTEYGEIGGLWFDGNWSKPDADWREDELYATIRKHQPEAMIINNTGLGALGRTGHPELDSVTFEQGRPTPIDRSGMRKYVCAEMCQTMNAHWGIGAHDFRYLSPKEMIETLCACRKVGANYLLNVGPTGEGAIPEYESAALRRVGEWVRRHADAIYHGKPADIAGNSRDFALAGEAATYYFVHDLGVAGHGDVTATGGRLGPCAFSGVKVPVKALRWMDSGQALAYAHNPDAGLLTFDATGYPYGTDLVVRVAVSDA
jgi:alpha-L-fucosidase